MMKRMFLFIKKLNQSVSFDTLNITVQYLHREMRSIDLITFKYV